MHLEHLAQYISIPLPDAWKSCGQEAMDRYCPDWLEHIDFDGILDYYEFPKEFYPARLHEELEVLRQDEDLNRICWLMHYVLFYGDDEDRSDVWRWGKGASKPFAEHGSPTTCVVAQLAGQPIHARNMAQRGYDEEQIQIHKRGVRACWMGQRNTFGIDGMGFGLMVWGTYFMHGNLVRLGRLQYEFNGKEIKKYSHLFDGNVGYIKLHIPRSHNGLRDDEVEQSIQMAAEKLDRYFPELAGKKKVFCVHTWLLSPQLREMLKPDSNIIKFQNRFTITDPYEGTASFLNNAFNISAAPGTFDYNTLPEDTSLRREIKKRLLRGETLQNAWGYFTL